MGEWGEHDGNSVLYVQFTILDHDKAMFEEPEGWHSKSITESPLVNNFSAIWSQLKEKYRTEISALAYRPIPDEESVAKCFEGLI